MVYSHGTMDLQQSKRRRADNCNQNGYAGYTGQGVPSFHGSVFSMIPPSVNSQDQNGGTQLHAAIMSGENSQAMSLLKRHANPNITNLAGWTPLHVACSLTNVSCVEVLLQHGASPNLTDNRGRTAVHLVAEALYFIQDPCKRERAWRILELVLQHSGNLYATEFSGRSSDAILFERFGSEWTSRKMQLQKAYLEGQDCRPITQGRKRGQYDIGQFHDIAVCSQ